MDSRIQGVETQPGYVALYLSRLGRHVLDDMVFAPDPAYRAYNKIHKVFVGESGASQLIDIHEALKHSSVPEVLNASAWAAAEASLVKQSMNATDRLALLGAAEECWTKALLQQETINHSPEQAWLREDVASYRLALNIAFLPLMKAIVAGNITSGIRASVFTDTLAIAQSASLQRKLSFDEGDIETGSGYLGFEHECNAHLSLLHMDDPRYVPLPSTARAGSGHDYPDQTHDIMVINQHWGTILKVTPVEIKSHASLRDLKRYRALIVRGKMHLSVNGAHSPEFTQHAFTDVYEGDPSSQSIDTVAQVTQTVRELLQMYQQGDRELENNTTTRFHSTDQLAKQRTEFSVNRGNLKR